MKRQEMSIDDPLLESTVRIVGDEDGLWYAFFADGDEYVADSADELARQIGARLARMIAARA